MTRGGKREGAGRKHSEKTKRISVPETLVPEVEALIQDYKNSVHKPFSPSLIQFIETFPEYENNLDILTPIGVLFEDWDMIKNVPRQHRKVIIKIMQKT